MIERVQGETQIFKSQPIQFEVETIEDDIRGAKRREQFWLIVFNGISHSLCGPRYPKPETLNLYTRPGCRGSAAGAVEFREELRGFGGWGEALIFALFFSRVLGDSGDFSISVVWVVTA